MSVSSIYSATQGNAMLQLSLNHDAPDPSDAEDMIITSRPSNTYMHQ